MSHDDLVTLAAGSHAALLVGVLAAYYKFGDRTEIIASSLHGTEGTLNSLRRRIAGDLFDSLRDSLASLPPATSIIVQASTEAYVERPSNAFESERFRDCIREFVEGDSGSLIECRNLVACRDSWLSAAKGLGIVLLLFAAYEGAVVGSLMFLDRTEVYQFSNLAVKFAAIPSVLFFVSAIACMLQMLRRHNRITEIRLRYAED